MPGTATVSDTEAGGRGSTIVACVSESRLVVFLALRLFSVGDLGGLDDAVDLRLLRRVERIEVLRWGRRAQLSDR